MKLEQKQINNFKKINKEIGKKANEIATLYFLIRNITIESNNFFDEITDKFIYCSGITPDNEKITCMFPIEYLTKTNVEIVTLLIHELKILKLLKK